MLLYDNFNDEELIQLLKTGDQQAFTELYNRYHEAVYGYIIAQVKLPQITQDIVHEVFLKLWEIRERLELRASFAAYLFRICRNKAVDFLRATAADQALRNELLRQYETQADMPVLSIEELQRMDALVETALSSLTPQRRAVFVLCRKEGKTYQEVALQLGISHNTVKEHMAKALATLRSFVQQQGDLVAIVWVTEVLLN